MHQDPCKASMDVGDLEGAVGVGGDLASDAHKQRRKAGNNDNGAE